MLDAQEKTRGGNKMGQDLAGKRNQMGPAEGSQCRLGKKHGICVKPTTFMAKTCLFCFGGLYVMYHPGG